MYAEAFACTERSGDLGIKQHLHSTAGDIALQMGEILHCMHVVAAIRPLRHSNFPGTRHQ